MTLLERSRNFAPFFAILSGSYPARSDQLVSEAVIQLLWDGTDGVSYLRRVSAQPFEGQAPKSMLVDVARGDHQVATVTSENAARSTIGLKVLENYDVDRTVPLADSVAYPYTGSGLVNWSFGSPWADEANQPPPEKKAKHADPDGAQDRRHHQPTTTPPPPND